MSIAPKCTCGMSPSSFCLSGVKECKQFPAEEMEKKYPIGGYAPGNYECKCCTCGEQFAGDKRAVQCEPCAVKDKAVFDALSPTEQEELIKRNSAVAHIMYTYAGSGDQIIANQVAGMPLEEAIFQAGYSAGYDNGYERGKREAGPAGAIWVIGDYDRLYDQLKAEPERKIVCWVDYQWGLRNEPKETLRDICAIMGKVMGFNARGIGYGGAEIWVGEETEKIEFLSECERLHVQWLDESAADTWISVDDQLPLIGEYILVYNTEGATLVGSLLSNGWVAMFADGEQLMGELTVTHWRELPEGPKR